MRINRGRDKLFVDKVINSDVVRDDEWLISMNKSEKGSDINRDICVSRVGQGGFAHRKHARSLLESSDFEEVLKRTEVAPEKMINALLCCLYDIDETIRWRAVRAVGITVSAIAGKALELSRTIMRRLIWSLNDESGGIGWGAPEAMGEIMAENETLALEYHRILVSYIDEDGNPLENDELERGVMWGISRLAQKRPELLRDWTGLILAQLNSPDLVRKGLALRTLLFLVDSSPGSLDLSLQAALPAPLLQNQSQIRIFQDGSFEVYTIGGLASKLLERLTSSADALDD